jgi:oligosaccharide repeat unit polymerase
VVILLYIFLLLCMVLLSIKLSRGDYFNLTLIFLAGYLLSAICCLYNVTIWGVNLHLKTIFILFLGMFAFMCGCYLGKRVGKKSEITVGVGNNLLNVIQRGEEKWKLSIVVIFDVCMIFLLYRDIVRIASANMVSWGNLFYNFRSNLGNDNLDVGYSTVVNFGLRITKPLAYIYAAIFAERVVNPENKNSIFNKVIYLIPVVIYAFQVILQGYRIQLVALIIALIFDLFFFFQIVYEWKARINFKIALRICVFFILICIGFYYVKFFIGKLQESNGVVAYVTNYFGGSLQLFDMYLENPSQKGYETFAALVDSLKKLGLFEGVKTVVQHEYRSANTGVYIGNVYTGFRNYYNDYGVIGVLFFSSLYGYIFSKWYRTLKIKRAWKFNSVFSFLLYSCFLYTIVFHFFTDYFFALMGVGWCVNILMFYMTSVFIFKIKVGRR